MSIITQGKLHRLPLIISGPSGVGKSTLISKLFRRFPHQFQFSVSCTTRPPRVREKNGVHYHFLTQSEFSQKIEDSAFIEYCQVHQHFYGTLLSEVEKVVNAGKICLLDIDVQGALKISEKKIPFNGIFIKPKYMKALEDRLRARNSDSEDSIRTRISNSIAEIEAASNNSHIYKHIVISDDLSQTTQSFISVVQSLYPDLPKSLNDLLFNY